MAHFIRSSPRSFVILLTSGVRGFVSRRVTGSLHSSCYTLYGVSVYSVLKKILGSRYSLEQNSDGILEPLDWGSITTLGDVWDGYSGVWILRENDNRLIGLVPSVFLYSCYGIYLYLF